MKFGSLPLSTCLLCLWAFFALLGCSESTNVRSITIYAAASLGDAIEEIAPHFEEENDCELALNLAGSGALAQQIMASPKADVFISANTLWMDTVDIAGRIDSDSRTDILSNALVLIANQHSDIQLESAADLQETNFELISIGNPTSVPAGTYAKKWLEAQSHSGGVSVWKTLENKTSFAPDVRSALQQVITKRSVIGLVYYSDYLSEKEKLRLLFTVPSAETGPISYPAAIIANSKQPELSRLFLDFLSSPIAKEIFENHGFTSLEN